MYKFYKNGNNLTKEKRTEEVFICQEKITEKQVILKN